MSPSRSVGQYALFAFYSYLHLIEVALCGERVLSHLSNHYEALDGADDGDGVASPGGAADSPRGGDGGGLVVPERNAAELFDSLLEDVAAECKIAQKKLTTSCDLWSNIKMHYFVFALAQLLVVLNHAKLHTTGALRGVGYPYHWYLQDAVFLVSGTAIVVVTIFASSKVTSKCAEIKAAARGVADARDTKTNAAAVSAVVDHHLHGATVWGETINQQKIIMIMWGFLVVALNAIIELLGANYNVRSDDRAVSFDA